MNISNQFNNYLSSRGNDPSSIFSAPKRPYYIGLLFICLVFVFIARFNYGRNLHLSGDEVGVGVLQSAGNWSQYKNAMPCNIKTDVFTVKKFIEISENTSAADVISTMRADRLHPPLYFIMLHFIIKYFGTSVVVLRTLSILFSVFSIIAIYHLGKNLLNEQVGLISAFFMSISAYCLEYSVMVRLYPLAMMLSLLSSLMVVKLVKSNGFHFRNALLYGYIFASVAGLYTYYSFVVLIGSQFIFVILLEKRNFRAILQVLLTYALIIILLLPWVFPMIEGINAVQSKDYYFTGTYSIVALVKYFEEIIFIPFIQQLTILDGIELTSGLILLSLAIVFLYVKGIYNSAKSRLVIAYFFSVFLYFAAFIVSDKILGTKTMMFDRQHYFSVPVLLLLLATSALYVSKKKSVTRLIVVFLSILFVAGFFYRYRHKSVFDGPYYFQQLTEQLNQATLQTNDKENLVMYNAIDKRYLLPFVYNTRQNFDLVLIPNGVNDTILQKIDHLTNYRNIFLVNIAVSAVKRKRLNMQEINVGEVSCFLHENGFADDQKPYVYQSVEKLTINQYHRK